MQKVAFYTLGCKVNQYETEAMTEIFKNEGYEITHFEDFSDIYVINTCTVTSMSDRKSRQIIRRAKKKNPDAIIEKGRVSSTSDFENGKVSFAVPLENIPEGEYILVAEEFVGTKKADRPLPIRGKWTCSFIKE